MAEYARREGFDADAAYRWRRVLRRTGQWIEANGTPAVSKAATVKKRKTAVRFARVAVKDMPPASASLVLRLVLTNGRRAALEMDSIAHLGEVLGVLMVICADCSPNCRKPKPLKTSRRSYPSTRRRSRQGRTYLLLTPQV
jgi:transposase-like protein